MKTRIPTLDGFIFENSGKPNNFKKVKRLQD